MNPAALSLRDLAYLVALVDERHFGRAAERCNVSQPALSAQIRKLEDSLGLTLVERTSRRVLPTPGGEAVARQARLVLAEAARLVAVAHSGRETGLAGPFALAAIATLGPYLFPRILRPLRQAFPDLSLQLSEGRTADILDALREGRVDAALVSLPLDEPGGLATAPLFTEPFWFACPAGHPLLARRDLSPAHLAGPDLLLLDEGNCLRDQALRACEIPGAGRHATSLETLRSMVAAGAGYTLLPRLSAREDEDGLVRCRPFAAGNPGRVVALATRASDPRARDLADLAAFLRTNPPPGTEAAAG